ncbi:MAG: hypothetical protein J6J27_05600 [Alphaproteobacteria bacterium]|nr:hypothetical protein [Alphaproteobacteria bacterium]
MNQEKIVNKILCYMKNEIEKSGSKPDMECFDFSFSEKIDYFNAPSEILPNGEDLTNVKNILKKVSDKSIKEVLNKCLANNYIKYFAAGGKNFKNITLTEEGFARATSVENYHPIKNYFSQNIPDKIVNAIISIIVSCITTYITIYITMKGGK